MNRDEYTAERIGRRLKAIREYLGYDSLKDFANDNGFPNGTYGHWERGVRKIPTDASASLVHKYRLTLDFIYLGRIDTLPHKIAVELKSILDESE